MNEFIRYLVMSSACLAALYLVYLVFLGRDTFFVMNRVYLLSSVILSLLLPLFPFRFTYDESIATMVIFLQPVLITPDDISAVTRSHAGWINSAAVIYFTGVAIFTIRFIVQLIQILFLVRRNGISRKEGINLVLLEREFSPFSFFHLIFIRKELEGNDRLLAIIDHEQVHVRQVHSADLLITELLTIILWFNPFAWLMQRSVKTVHEFLADEGVLRKGISGNDYRRMIFDQTLGIQVNNLTNNFNVSILKKRMIMMTKSRSAKIAGIKAIFALPVLFAVLFFFSAGNIEKLSAQTQKEADQKAKQQQIVESTPGGDVYRDVKNPPAYPGGMDQLVQFLVSNIKYPEAAKKAGLQGTVYVEFIVEKDGSVKNVKVNKGIDRDCDAEAARVVGIMPKWQPGSNEDNKPLRVKVVLPIKFALDEKKVEKK